MSYFTHQRLSLKTQAVLVRGSFTVLVRIVVYLLLCAASISHGAYIKEVSLADVTGNMPYVAATPVNRTGQAGGVLAVGQTATVKFSVVADTAAAGTITNIATGDIDGAGAAPDSLVSVISPFS